MPKNIIKRWWQNLKYSPFDAQRLRELPRVVVIGGGTGLSVLLRGLKELTPNISAIVAVTDNGKSSGFLRKTYKTLPPGDLRQCIAALSPEEETLTKLLNYRFIKGDGLKGHTVGNLLTVAMTDIEGGFDRAIIGLCSLLNTTGEVLPVTLDRVQLIGLMASGEIIEGEEQISISGHKDPIKSVSLSKRVKAYPPVLAAIKQAEIIVLGPGSLYTSVIPPLLVRSVCEAIRTSRALKIYICNASTERGETEGYTVEKHLEAVEDMLGKKVIDICLVNNELRDLPGAPEGKFGSVHQITTHAKVLRGVSIQSERLASIKNPLYHDSQKLAAAVMRAYTKYKDGLK